LILIIHLPHQNNDTVANAARLTLVVGTPAHSETHPFATVDGNAKASLMSRPLLT
jgi:hypothetical protein